MEIKKVFHATRTVVLVTAVLLVLHAVYQVYEDLRRYKEKPEQIQEILTRVLAEVYRQREDSGNGTSQGVQPIVSARAVGPDLTLDVGEGLDLELRTMATPDGATTVTAMVTGYATGCYRIREAPNALMVFEAIRQTLISVLGSARAPEPAAMEVIGGADGIPMRELAVYRGDLGLIREQSFYSYDEQSNRTITLIPNVTHLTNDAIAFLRAYDAADYLRTIPVLSDASARFAISTTSRAGGKYRRSMMHIRMPHLLDKEYKDLPYVARALLEKGP